MHFTLFEIEIFIIERMTIKFYICQIEKLSTFSSTRFRFQINKIDKMHWQRSSRSNVFFEYVFKILTFVKLMKNNHKLWQNRFRKSIFELRVSTMKIITIIKFFFFDLSFEMNSFLLCNFNVYSSAFFAINEYFEILFIDNVNFFRMQQTYTNDFIQNI